MVDVSESDVISLEKSLLLWLGHELRPKLQKILTTAELFCIGFVLVLLELFHLWFVTAGFSSFGEFS